MTFTGETLQPYTPIYLRGKTGTLFWDSSLPAQRANMPPAAAAASRLLLIWASSRPLWKLPQLETCVWTPYYLLSYINQTASPTLTFTQTWELRLAPQLTSNFWTSNWSFSMFWPISDSRGSTLAGSPIWGFFTYTSFILVRASLWENSAEVSTSLSIAYKGNSFPKCENSAIIYTRPCRWKAHKTFLELHRKKQGCSIFLNNWSSWGGVLKNKKIKK